MRQLNFLFIFLICLALVLFSLENTALVPIQITTGVQVEAPLSVELIIALGLGAVLAWIFSLWSRMQRMVASFEPNRRVRQKEERIQALEQDIEQYKVQQAELEEKLPLLLAGQKETASGQTTEVKGTDAIAN